ncbi:MAG: type II toxin-antitoxin system ParD family antitoxin [Chloroflexi bacterium]|nr:type II toxin-antitoxin system ParD family antitoxin [Chloroflexota bacterium]
MPTRNVVLTQHQQDLIETLVGSGRYQNASEVLREGLRLVEQQTLRNEAELEALRAAVQVGLDDLDVGRYVELERDELEDYLTMLGERAATRVASA